MTRPRDSAVTTPDKHHNRSPPDRRATRESEVNVHNTCETYSPQDRSSDSSTISPLTLPAPEIQPAARGIVSTGKPSSRSSSAPAPTRATPFVLDPECKVFTVAPIDPIDFTMPISSAGEEEMAALTKFDINIRPPIVNPLRGVGVQSYGVVKIFNVPFNVTIAEVKHLISRVTTAPLIKDHEQGFPVHIIIERPTGKTMECYVEFQHKSAAEQCVLRAETNATQGKPAKIGTRHIRFELSSEAELVSALFPRAKSCTWNDLTGLPHIGYNDDPYSEGFQGFFTVEEMTNIVKQAQYPQKSQYNSRCPQRTYESMVSTLYKFPWQASNNYTVDARNFLFTAYINTLEVLMPKVSTVNSFQDTSRQTGQDREVGINHNLLMDYLFAGLNVPCFSLRQKFAIVRYSGSIGPGFPLESQASHWPFQALIPPRDFPSHVVDMWLAILDKGFETLAVKKLSHGFEEFVYLARDDLGYFFLHLTEAGRKLHFAKLVAIELTLSDMIIEKGRVHWCLHEGVPYAPLKSRNHFQHLGADVEIESSMRSTNLSSPQARNRRHSRQDA